MNTLISSRYTGLVQKAVAVASIVFMTIAPLPFPLFVAQAADTLFSDGFESGDFSAWNSFQTPQWAVSTGGANSGSYRAEIQGDTGSSDDIISKAVSTVGYGSVTLRYWYKVAAGLESNDYVKVEWYDGSSWHQVANYSNVNTTNNYTEAVHILPSTASHNSNFQFRFRAKFNSNGDVVRVDDVEVVAEPLEIVANPSLPNSCGLDIALVLDSSGSISTSELAQMKGAMKSFGDAFLPGTPTQFSVVDFDNTATVLRAFTGDASLINAAVDTPTSGGATNWEDALVKAWSTFDPRANPNLIIFASDGNPTVNNGPGGGSTGGTTDGNDLLNAIAEANSIKGAETRIIALGIGNDLDVENLKAISGPNVDTGASSDVITTNFSTLASDLAELASELCGGTITVRKVNDVDGNSETTDDRTPEEGWMIDIDGSPTNPDPVATDADGYTPAVEVDAGTYSIAETLKDGYDFVSASCEKSGGGPVGSESGNGVSGVEVGNSDIISCIFINHKNLPPVITLLGDNPVELVVNVDSYSEAGATADDAEDGNDFPVADIDSSAVNTGVVGSYSVFYNFNDSDGLAAGEVTRTVNVVAGANQCNDTLDNDDDGFTDYPEDPGCESIVDPSENEPPVIALTGANPQVVTLGSAYTELGATADDAEDGQDITVTDIDSSAVDTSVVGSYLVFYNFTDSDGAAAAEVIREVKVKTACSDGIDNDGDGNIDDEDAGCEGTQDNDENAKPEIELVGLSLVSVVAGDPYNEQGAVAHDEEDGDNPAVIGGDAVNTSIPGTYVVAYNYTDSDGVSANEVTRTVVVTAKPQCSDGEDNDEDGKTDSEDPACHTDGDAGNSGSYDPELNDEGDDPAPSPQCSDGVDNDGDGKIDYPADSGCSAASDNDESNPLFDCNDGGDNDNDGLIDMADPDCSDPSDDSESGSSGSGGGGGDSSSGSGGGGGGGGNGPIFNLTFPSSGGGGGGGGGSPGLVLGAAAEDNLPEGCSAYLWEYIHIGRKNNPEQVKKLQMFLNTEMGANLPITGFYGSLSYSWVEKFQVKYWEEVLKPWVPHGLPTEKTPTGYVYKTTRRWINMLNCPSLNLPIPPLP